MQIGLQPGTRMLKLERSVGGKRWLIWLHEEECKGHGTYLELHEDGQIDRVTERADGTFERFLVKPPDYVSDV